MSSVSYKRVGSVEQYLRAYAEPEAALAPARGAVRTRRVVPGCAESVDFLDGYTRAFEGAPGPTLCVVVVNGAEDAEPAVHAENARCFAQLLDRLIDPARVAETPALWWGRLRRAPSAELLVVDRQSVSFRLPEKQGVGLAGARFRPPLALYARERCARLDCEPATPTWTCRTIFPSWNGGMRRRGHDLPVRARRERSGDVDRASALSTSF